MEKTEKKVEILQEYRDKKRQSEIDRKELIALIIKAVAAK